MSDSKPRRKLAAILAADVVGFSKMMGENEDRTLKNLKACRSLTDESIISNHGRIFGSAGDSIIAEFASPVDAMEAAITIQKEVSKKAKEIQDNITIEFRIGINLGDIMTQDNNLYGDNVNIASRLETLSKQFKCELVISKYVALKANMKTDNLLTRKVKIRGRKDSLEIFTFNKGTEIII